jgi:hypothetical protein
MFFLCVFKAGIIRHGTHGGECAQAPQEHQTAHSSGKKKKKKKKQETEKMNKTTRKKKIKKGSFSIHFVRLGQTGSIKGPLSGLRIFLLSPILGFVFFPEKSNQKKNHTYGTDDLRRCLPSRVSLLYQTTPPTRESRQRRLARRSISFASIRTPRNGSQRA